MSYWHPKIKKLFILRIQFNKANYNLNKDQNKYKIQQSSNYKINKQKSTI